MRLLRYVLRSMNILNLLLVTALALLVIYLFPFVTMRLTYGSPKVQKTIEAQLDKPGQSQSPPPSEYMVVAEQNVFHPERKIPPESKDERDKDKHKPEIVLYGTLIADGMRLAYLEDRKSPQSTPGRGKRQSVVKQGETVSGFVLKSVEEDRIVLVRGEEQIIASVSDPDKRTPTAPLPQPAVAQRSSLPSGGSHAAKVAVTQSVTPRSVAPPIVPTKAQMEDPQMGHYFRPSQ